MKEYINRIIHGNCIKVMKKLPDESIDLVVTSPPYDDLREYEGYSFDFESIADELYRIVKDRGVVVWIVADRTIKGNRTLTSFRQSLYFQDIGFNVHDVMIYQKLNTPFMRKNAYTNNHEYMFIFSKGSPNTFNPLMDITVRNGYELLPYNKISDGINKKNLRRLNESKVKTNIWSYAVGLGGTTSDKYAFDHPAMFPEALARDHIITWSNKNDIVLDPMCGAGTTCKMAKELGRKFIGIDISKKYCDIAQRRVDSTLMKTTLDEYNNSLKGEEL